MKFIFIVANWKSYKTKTEALEWFQKFYAIPLDVQNKEIIICPPFPLLPTLFEYKLQVNSSQSTLVRLGSQNISPFDEGAYTGEVTAKTLQEYCAYSIIGHSERRDKFHETDDMLAKKVTIAKQYNITPIYCVQGTETIIPTGVTIAAYEPVSAIGTGNPDTPENAAKVAKQIKEKRGIQYVLYGGSVTVDNVKSFTALSDIDGVLIGGSSLNAENFVRLIKNA